MSNVGFATLSIIPSARGFGPALDGEVAPATKATGERASKGLVSSIGGSALAVGKIAAGAVAAVGGIVGALSIKGGIARQLQIEDAQAKLSGLGHSTDSVKNIMDSALASVKGTAFGMGEAATAAAGATAAGIAPGQELTRVLSLMADSATIAGTDMASMGSIFNKVAASGKLQGDVIAQLQDAGVPVLQFVAKEMGVTAGEASKLASSGAVDFETFANAMENGLGGAAQRSGDTTRGAFANMKAAFSRFGVTLSGPFVSQAKGAFALVMNAVDGLNNLIAPVMAAFGAAFANVVGPALEGAGAKVETFFARVGEVTSGVYTLLSTGNFEPFAGLEEDSGVVDVLFSIRENFQALATAALPVIGGIVGAFGPLLAKIPLVGGAFGALTGPFGIVAGLIAALFAASPALRDSLGGIFSALGPALSGIAASLGPVLTTLGTTVGTLLAVVGDSLATIVSALGPVVASVLATLGTTLGTLGPTITTVVSALAPLVEQLLPVLASVIASVLPPIATLASAVLPVLAEIFGTVAAAVLPLVGALVAALLPVLQTLSTTLGPLFGAIVVAIAPLIAQLGSSLIPIISALLPVVTTVFSVIASVITSAMQIVQGVIQVVTGLISGNWGQVWQGLQNVVSGVWNTIKSLISGALAIVSSVISAALGLIRSVFASAWNGLVGLVSGAWSGITSAISSGVSSAVSFVSSLPGKILSALSSLGSLLVSVGSNMMQGLIDGAKSMAGKIASAVLAPIKDAVDGVKSFLGIHSPSRLFRAIGVFTGEGMALGLEDSAGRVARASDALIPAVPTMTAPAAETFASVPARLGGAGTGTTPRGGDTTWNLYETVSPTQLAQEVARRQKGLAA